MAILIKTKKELEDWEHYRLFMKERLKQLAPDGPIEFFVTKDKFTFQVKGKPWPTRAVLVGPKGLLAVKQLKKQGLLFREGTCTLEGKEFHVEGLQAKLVKDAHRTVKKLLLGYSVALDGLEGEDADDDTGGGELEAQWKALKAEVTPRVKAALGSRPDLKERVTQLLGTSVQQEKAQDWAGAIATFRTLDGELEAGPALRAELRAAARDGLKAWEKALGDVAKEVDRLKKAVLETAKQDPNMAKEAAQRVKKLDVVPRKLDKGLRSKLQEIEKAADGAAQAAAAEEATALLKQIAGVIGKDPMIKSLDANPLQKTKIRLTATNALKELDAKLSA